MKVLDTFKGHLVLLCKHHYKTDDFFKALGQLWAVRCGWDYCYFTQDTYRHIADSMFEILKEVEPDRILHHMETVHREVVKTMFKPTGLTPIQCIIWEYRSIISNLQIKEREGDVYTILISLPKPQKQIINRILRGNGQYEDHAKLRRQDKRPQVSI